VLGSGGGDVCGHVLVHTRKRGGGVVWCLVAANGHGGGGAKAAGPKVRKKKRPGCVRPHGKERPEEHNVGGGGLARHQAPRAARDAKKEKVKRQNRVHLVEKETESEGRQGGWALKR